MGAYQLTDFRSRLNMALGNRGHTNAELDLWINAGYYELVGAIEFERLKETLSLAILDGTYQYATTSVLAVTGVVIPDKNHRLIKTSVESLAGRPRTTDAMPRFWAWSEGSLDLWPTPDANYTGYYTVLKEPAKLTGDTDTTVLPATWDTAVHMFAASQAYLDIGEDQRSLFWLSKARAYAGSRMTDAEMGAEAVSEPAQPMGPGESLNTIYP